MIVGITISNSQFYFLRFFISFKKHSIQFMDNENIYSVSKNIAKQNITFCQTKCFAGKANSRRTHETFYLAKSFVFPYLVFTNTIYISSLAINCKEYFSKRNPQKMHLRVRDCYTHNHLHISLQFSSTPTSPSLDH